MLYLYWRVAFGAARNADAAAMPDLTAREWSMLAPIAPRCCGWASIRKASCAPMRDDVGVLLARLERAAPAGDVAA